MHEHPLHRRVTAECLCCQLRSDFEFTSKSDHVICKGCLRHQRSSPARLLKRDADHVSLWSSELKLAEEAQDLERQQAAAVPALEGQLLELRGELSDMRGALTAEISQHPVASVEAWFKGEEISAAHRARDESYRSRDRALGILWNLDALHHDDQSRGHFCSCGKPTPQCREWNILETTRSFLYAWEQRQVDRLRRYLPHALPDNRLFGFERGSAARRGVAGGVGRGLQDRSRPS